ncbi:uncharacterized protein J3D65DRAFT_600866 [Phyllosticta citribraziliensis]|uniref:Uncharacterized protein n=1 Tax=Phyllosticta citribraziliensis TaxID=989973 RepID=A0ABR1LZY0_9PEZI
MVDRPAFGDGGISKSFTSVHSHLLSQSGSAGAPLVQQPRNTAPGLDIDLLLPESPHRSTHLDAHLHHEPRIQTLPLEIYQTTASMAGFRKWSLKVQEKTMKVFRSSSGEVKEAPSTPKSAAHDESASPLESASAPDKSTGDNLSSRNGVTLSEGAHLSKTSKPNRKPYGELETPPTKPAKVETKVRKLRLVLISHADDLFSKKHDSHHQSANSTPSPRYTLFPSENISFTKRLPPAEVIRLMREGRMKDAYGKDDGEE